MLPPTGRFWRSERLRDPRDFRRVTRSGRRIASRDFVVFVAPRPTSLEKPDIGTSRRLGITASRKVGNAVVRNRIKRSVREWFRASRHELGPDVDIVVIARRPGAELSGPAIGRELSRMLGLGNRPLEGVG